MISFTTPGPYSPRSCCGLGSCCFLIMDYNPGFLGEPSWEDTIILETIIKGFSYVIRVRIPNGFFAQGR